MDDIKLFDKNEKKLETRMQTLRIYSQHIGMGFGIEKCAKLVIKSGKRHMKEGRVSQSYLKITQTKLYNKNLLKG